MFVFFNAYHIISSAKQLVLTKYMIGLSAVNVHVLWSNRNVRIAILISVGKGSLVLRWDVC